MSKYHNGERNYLRALKLITEKGKLVVRDDITNYIEYQGVTITHHMQQGFPLLTTKKMPFNLIKQEFIWMYEGNTNVKGLHKHGIKYWDTWADENGELGPVYGKQFRDANGVDQIKYIIDGLKTKPNRRRYMIDLFNVGDLEDMSLPPCVFAYQFIHDNGYLDMIVYQRSGDMFLGVPFDMAQSALLLWEIANKTNLKPRKITMMIGSAHIYINHLDQVTEQLKRKQFKLPKLDGDKLEDVEVIDYESHEHIKGDLTHIPKGDNNEN